MGRQSPSGSISDMPPSNRKDATVVEQSRKKQLERDRGNAEYKAAVLNSAFELAENIESLKLLLEQTTVTGSLSGGTIETEELENALTSGIGLPADLPCHQIRPPSPVMGKNPAASVYLPQELIYEIVSYVTDQKALYSASLVSRSWYSAATPLLYAKPGLHTSNFASFVAAVAPTIQAPTRKLKKDNSSNDLNEYLLCDLVKELDLINVGKLEHICSWTGRLLSHTRKSLLYFRAPMHGIDGTVTRLKYPRNLVELDFSLCVESVELTAFCAAVMQLPKLQILKFPPTSSIYVADNSRNQRIPNTAQAHHPLANFEYPPQLQQLFLSGSVGDSFLMSSRPIPESIRLLSLSHFPFARPDALRHIILRFAPHLTALNIYHPIPRLSHDFCDRILFMCPHVKQLGVSVDYCTSHLFDEENTPDDHPLEELHMRASQNGWRRLKVTADDISIALMEGRLRNLRVVRASKRLEWDRDPDKLEDLVQLLQMDRSTFDFDADGESSGELNPEDDKELPTVEGVEAGVWLTQ